MKNIPLLSIWTHTNGNRYQVVLFTNIETSNTDKYPTTVVYQNVHNLKCYSRPVADWHRSMTIGHPLSELDYGE